MQSEQSIGEAASNAVGAVVEKAQEVGQAAVEKTGAVMAEVKTAVVNTASAASSAVVSNATAAGNAVAKKAAVVKKAVGASSMPSGIWMRLLADRLCRASLGDGPLSTL